MDPITHGLLGASASQVSHQNKLGKKVWIAGALSAMAPDLDVLIQSEAHPLWRIIYHRHFTHSLSFIPVGGLIITLLLCLFPAFRKDWKKTYLACTLAYGTHCLLDACTSYGTMLFWPFSDVRVSWDVIPIIDLFVTVPLGIGVFLAAKFFKNHFALAALILSFCYLSLGSFQHNRALKVQTEMAAKRGDLRVRGRATPTMGNVVVWNSIYEANGEIVMDSIRVPLFDTARMDEGWRENLVTMEDAVRDIQNPKALDAFRIFHWFTDGFVIRAEKDPLKFGDGRYTWLKHKPMWGILLDVANETQPVSWWRSGGNRREHLQKLWERIWK